MTSAYFTQAELESRLSAKVVAEIYDDANAGSASAAPIAALISDSSSKVDSYLRGVYTLPLTVVPNEVKRLALDVAVAYAAQRHAEYVRRDWKPLMEQVEKDLKRLRTGETRLDVAGTPEPAANEGGNVVNGTTAEPDTPFKFFSDMGDF